MRRDQLLQEDDYLVSFDVADVFATIVVAPLESDAFRLAWIELRQEQGGDPINMMTSAHFIRRVDDQNLEWEVSIHFVIDVWQIERAVDEREAVGQAEDAVGSRFTFPAYMTHSVQRLRHDDELLLVPVESGEDLADEADPPF